MNDWREFVHERLGHLGLPEERRLEIISELADHLADGEEKSAGSATRTAVHWMAEETDWSALCRNIRRAEGGNMNDRTRNLWIPGLAMLVFSGFLLRLATIAGMAAGWQTSIVWFDPQWPALQGVAFPLVFNLPWLVMLPALGALGAWWSKREGGAAAMRVLVGLFPAVTYAALLLLSFLVFSPILDAHVPLAVKSVSLAVYMVGWVLIPGALLLLGAAPFLQNGIGKSAAAH